MNTNWFWMIAILGCVSVGCENGTHMMTEGDEVESGLSASDGRAVQQHEQPANQAVDSDHDTQQVNPVPVSEKVIWASDFEDVDLGDLPGEYLVLEGNYTVKEMEGNKVLHLPGAPLGAKGVLVASGTKDANVIQASVYSTRTGRRYPTIGVGLRGIRGYRLYVSGARRTIEIVQGEQPVKSVACRWVSGQWVTMKLKLVQENELWVVEGKVWFKGEPEPDEWMIRYETKDKPAGGRASLWGLPYSTKPILFDNVKTTQIGE